jgi:hypothetical protein
MERSRAWTALTLCALSHLTAKAFTFRIALGELDNTNQGPLKTLAQQGLDIHTYGQRVAGSERLDSEAECV